MDSFDIRDILREAGSKNRDLTTLLLRVQERFGFVPPSVLPDIARHVHRSESEIFGVLSFYRVFHLAPRGRHRVAVCHGTSCHVRGCSEVLDALSRALGIEPGATTADGAITLETVDCLGCCAIGPFGLIDGVFHPRWTPEDAVARIEELRAGEKNR
jgi:NADH:ubiquinone oxidoreductase subunit E